jgi:DNA-binding CsgD family transcriptional regulator/PAS domain-containing protein
LFDPITPDFVAELFSRIVDPEGFAGIADYVFRRAGAATGAVWIVENSQLNDISITDAGRESMVDYAAHYNTLDLWQRNVTRMPRDQVVLACEHTPENELVKSEFYNDFARRYGLFRPLGAMVQLRPGTVATISIERQNATRLLDVEDKPNFQRFIPYVKRALQLRLRHRDEAARADLYSAALGSLTFGTVICDAQSHIIFANPAAETLARVGAGIVFGRLGRGLAAISPAETGALAALIHATARGGPGGVLRLTGQDGTTSLLVLVTPLPRPPHGDFRPGYALVSLRSARDRPAFVEATLSALFRLSPTQAHIAMALHSGRTPEEIALERGIKISTLRTHLAEIFARTGAENQRDLIRLLGLLPPLRWRSGSSTDPE